MTRRDLLLASASLGLVASTPRLSFGSVVRPFRLIHLTDFHVQPELNAPDGMQKALIHAMAHKPNLIQLGGDLIMDGFSANEARTATQWKIFQELLVQHCKVPVQYCIGNHDVWGWNKSKSKTSGNEALWGKNWFLKVAGLERAYHSYQAGAWKVIVLDTVQPKGEDAYDGYVDEEQMKWFQVELDATPHTQPILVVSHIPIFSPSPMVYGFDAKDSTWKVGSSQVISNFNEVKKLFDARKNVKVCISGHIHLVDRYDYNNVSYLCNGAVCGGWWLGKNKDFEPGYVIIDLFPNGDFKHEFVTWGWKAKNS